MTSANSKGSECKGSGTLTIRHRTRPPGRFPPAAWPSGLGKGLQSPVHRFDSGRRLEAFSQVNPAFGVAHALPQVSDSSQVFVPCACPRRVFVPSLRPERGHRCTSDRTLRSAFERLVEAVCDLPAESGQQVPVDVERDADG